MNDQCNSCLTQIQFLNDLSIDLTVKIGETIAGPVMSSSDTAWCQCYPLLCVCGHGILCISTHFWIFLLIVCLDWIAAGSIYFGAHDIHTLFNWVTYCSIVLHVLAQPHVVTTGAWWILLSRPHCLGVKNPTFISSSVLCASYTLRVIPAPYSTAAMWSRTLTCWYKTHPVSYSTVALILLEYFSSLASCIA